MAKSKFEKYLRGANMLGLFFIFLFVLCFAWFFIRPVEQELHLSLLRLTFFGYTDMNVVSFIYGAVQSYIWAYIFYAVWMIKDWNK